MRIYHNIPALNAYNQLSQNQNALANSIKKLSSGLRINSAADDAAGLAISEKMRAQIRGLDVASRNAQDGISMIQTAEGALSSTNDILQRMRELAVQAANDTLTQQDREYIQLEINQLRDEVNRISTSTQFNKKRLLDGSASVLWSSNSLDTKLFIKGGLRQVDQFGQKNVAEGNYKVSISANPGSAEVQKSDIFKIKHKNVLSDLSKHEAIGDVRVDGLPAANYTVRMFNSGYTTAIMNNLFTAGNGNWGDVRLTGMFGLTVSAMGVPPVIVGSAAANSSMSMANLSGTAQVLYEVTNIDTATNVMTFKAIASVLRVDGTSETFVKEGLQVGVSAAGTVEWTAFGIAGTLFSLTGQVNLNGWAIGGKVSVQYLCAQTLNSGTRVIEVGEQNQNPDWNGYWSNGNMNKQFVIYATAIVSKDVQFRSFYINSTNGTVYESNVTLGINATFAVSAGSTLSAGGTLASFKSTFIGQTARMDTQLRDLDKFWDPNGKFMLDDPKTLTITQGDGKVATVTLYANDSLGDLVRKFNDAIAKGLEQGRFADNAMNFATFVTTPSANTSESVAGTMLIRTAINGVGGTLNFSGDEDIMNALSLNIIQQAKENEFYVSIQDAHSGQPLVNTVKVSGNYAVGLLHPNLDFEFDPSADMKVSWNNNTKKYETSSISASGKKAYETIIHIADNTAVFQIGANQGEDMSIDIGDMSSRSLGLHKVLLTNRGSAARSITIIDTALNSVASQRSKLGAYQNRLEYTVNNLTTAGENLTAAESRIRDLDMAKEMMNFTKLNILMQSGQSMLSQANQMPQAILQLLRG